jgi:hypothetical protein
MYIADDIQEEKKCHLLIREGFSVGLITILQQCIIMTALST